MHWYQVLMIVFLVLYGVGGLLADSVTKMAGRFIWLTLLVWALNAGGFFS